MNKPVSVCENKQQSLSVNCSTRITSGLHNIQIIKAIAPTIRTTLQINVADKVRCKARYDLTQLIEVSHLKLEIVCLLLK